MRVMLFALGGICLAFVLLAWRGTRREPPSQPIAKPPESSASRHRRELAPRPPKLAPPPEPVRLRPRPRSETAHVRGRVVGPAGVTLAELLDSLAVFAEEGERRYDALMAADGTFALHLPAGTYHFLALGALWVASEENVTVSGTVSLTLHLGPAAAIAGVVRGGEALDLNVLVQRVGTTQTREGAVTVGRFNVDGLLPGVAYEVKVQGGGIEDTTETVVAPADGVEVRPVVLPVLLIAVGFARGERCPIEGVQLSGEGYSAFIGIDYSECHFSAPVPPGRELTVTASGGGWHFSGTVVTPAQGDPPPLCLNPPCRSEQELEARRPRRPATHRFSATGFQLPTR